MVTPIRAWLIASALLGGAAVGVAVTWVILTRPIAVEGRGEIVVEQPSATFTISGDVDEPFFPGGSAPLDLTISNPLDTELLVSEVLVEIDAVDAPNSTALLPCGAGDFAVEQLSWPDDLVVSARATQTLTDLEVPREAWPLVRMLDTGFNQDGCKDATFSLVYSAVGRAAE